MKTIKKDKKPLIAKGPNGKIKFKRWHKITLLTLTPITMLTAGILTVVNAVFWYSPVVPKSKRADALDAHVFFEGNSLYSYSTDTAYDIKVIYGLKETATSNGVSFQINPNDKKALKMDIPIAVDNIEIDIHETSKINQKNPKDNLKDRVIKAHRKTDASAEWLSGGPTLKQKSLVDINNTPTNNFEAKILDINILDIPTTLTTTKGITEYKSTPEYKESNFVKARFTKKTPEEVVKAIDGISNMQSLIDKKYWSKPENEPLTKSKDPKFKFKPGVPYYKQSPHAIFWHATAEKSFKGLEGKVAGIEKDVMENVILFEYKGKHLWLIKSNPGTSATLGVKYGLLLAKNGFAFAGIPINGKTWMKDMGISTVPTGDTFGIYTVLVLDGVTQADKSIASEVAIKIGGVN